MFTNNDKAPFEKHWVKNKVGSQIVVIEILFRTRMPIIDYGFTQ